MKTFTSFGVAAPSFTILNGKYALRVAITNHRSVHEDFKMLTEEVVRTGRQLLVAAKIN